MLHRASGGGAVVVGPGCLNFALVLSLVRRPRLADVERSYEWLLGRLAGVLGMSDITVRSTDLAVHGRKFTGHAQRRLRGALLHHGVLLYDSDDFDLGLVDALLPEPSRRPAWRGDRTHREFLTNAPLGRDEVVRRLRRLPVALEQPAAWELAPQNAAERSSTAQTPGLGIVVGRRSGPGSRQFREPGSCFPESPGTDLAEE